jgi:hypothetical protein
MIIKSLKVNVKGLILLLFLFVFFTRNSFLSQERTSVRLFQIDELTDSIIDDEFETKSFFLKKIKLLKNIDKSDSKELVLTLKDWDKLNQDTKSKLSNLFHIQRFLYFTEKELEVHSWHLNFVINNYTYFISNNLYEQILIELSDD